MGNIVETFDDQGAIITGYDYDINSHSDSQFCKETLAKLGYQDEPTTLLADGAYASTDNHNQATQNNIELITTALIVKVLNPVQGDFIIDADNHEVIKCPSGNKPYKTRYYDNTGMYRASFNKKTCECCPLKDQCGAKFQKKSVCVMISEKMVQRASYLKSCPRKNTGTYLKNGTASKECLLFYADAIPWIIIPIRGTRALKNVVCLENRSHQCKKSDQRSRCCNEKRYF